MSPSVCMGSFHNSFVFYRDLSVSDVPQAISNSEPIAGKLHHQWK